MITCACMLMGSVSAVRAQEAENDTLYTAMLHEVDQIQEQTAGAVLLAHGAGREENVALRQADQSGNY